MGHVKSLSTKFLQIFFFKRNGWRNCENIFKKSFEANWIIFQQHNLYMILF